MKASKPLIILTLLLAVLAHDCHQCPPQKLTIATLTFPDMNCDDAQVAAQSNLAHPDYIKYCKAIGFQVSSVPSVEILHCQQGRKRTKIRVQICCGSDDNVCSDGEEGIWTEWLNRDLPSGTGDWETLEQFIKGGQACENPIDVQCQTTEGVSVSQTGQVLVISQSTGCICINSQQPDGICNHDYQARFKCCPECPEGKIGEWTDWLDRDNPSGTGDWEVLSLFVEQGKVCEEPISIICEEVGGMTIDQTGEQVIVSLEDGCICYNGNQLDGRCDYDYHVKFKCCNSACPQGQEPVWTDWLDRDNPSGKGDYETIADFPSDIVCESPLDIICQTTDGKPASDTEQNVNVDVLKGCWCVNSQQQDDNCDYDYRIKLLCCQKK